MGREIERKFQVAPAWEPPESADSVLLRQAYLTPPGSRCEVRIRATRETFLMTVKSDRSDPEGVARDRDEVEFPIDGASFTSLWTMAADDALAKRRWRIPVAGGTAEVDVYEGPLAGLRVAEVEFDSLEEATDFVPPPWFGEEVTGAPAFSNRELARRAATAPALRAED